MGIVNLSRLIPSPGKRVFIIVPLLMELMQVKEGEP
jgi:hypothetical protein